VSNTTPNGFANVRPMMYLYLIKQTERRNKMSYASDSVYGHSYSKWDTIQEDVADMYLDDVEDVEDDFDLDDVEDVEFDLDEWEEM